MYSTPDTVHGAQGTLARRVGEMAGYTRRERVHLNLKDFTSLYVCFLTLGGKTSKRQPLDRASISSRKTVRAKVERAQKVVNIEGAGVRGGRR